MGDTIKKIVWPETPIGWFNLAAIPLFFLVIFLQAFGVFSDAPESLTAVTELRNYLLLFVTGGNMNLHKEKKP